MAAKKHVVRTIEIPKGWKSSEAASFFSQMDELSGRMFTDLAGAGPAVLGWQPLPGMNTIGMLLAHNAIVEVFWIMIATESYSEARMRKVLGIDEDDDGMPLPANGRPPAALRLRSLAWYRRLHDRARAFARKTARTLGPADLRRKITRKRMDGSLATSSVRWILYHVLEHQAGHYGQMLLLLHLHRVTRKGAR